MRQFVALLCGGDPLRHAAAPALAAAGCLVHHCPVVFDLAGAARRHRPDIIVIGFAAADAPAALHAVGAARAIDRRVQVILATSDPSETTLIAALRARVSDCLREPLDPAALSASVRRCLAAVAQRACDRPANGAPADREQPFVGTSRAMRQIDATLARLAHHDATVLITGETGTGKELVAARIHRQSARHHGRFVSVNCAAIPDSLLESELFGYESGAFTGAVRPREGLLQLANRGTILLDEVGDLELQAQAKILRAIESREVYRLGGKRPERLDVRIIAATNQDLERAMEDGRFRKDLYFRLNVARIHLPPLRERRSDIVPLLEHYLQVFSRRDGDTIGFSDGAMSALQAYDWPGNVRELKNLVEAVLVGVPAGQIDVGDLPEDFRRRLHHAGSASDAERRRLLDALFTARWNKSKAAALLHCSRMTLYRKMAKYSVISSDQLSANLSHPPVTGSREKTTA